MLKNKYIEILIGILIGILMEYISLLVVPSMMDITYDSKIWVQSLWYKEKYLMYNKALLLQKEMGEKYKIGDMEDATKKLAESIKLLEKADESNFIGPAFNLALIYSLGVPGILEKDRQKCMVWMDRSKSIGNVRAEISYC